MPPATTAELDSAIRVSVVPSQAAFFAGEPFSVTITFTNTRNPDETSKRRTHKRAAHSISSAPLARPPTSPITPRTAVPAQFARGDAKDKNKVERRGLVGGISGEGGRGDLLERKGKKKALSVALTVEDLNDVLPANMSSPLRDSSVPVHHPHARKQSVQIDGSVTQSELQLKEMTLSPSPIPQSAAASTSAFSLTLDTIAEHAPSPVDEASAHSYPPQYPPQRPNYPPAKSGVGLGLGPPPLPPTPRTASVATFSAPHAALILYAYAQLAGTLTLSDGSSTGTPILTPSESQALNGVRVALVSRDRQVVGGGRMDIEASLDPSSSSLSASRLRPSSRRTHSRAVSLGSSLMSLLSPSVSTSTNAPSGSPTHKPRTPSIVASLLSSSVSSPAEFGRKPTSGSGNLGFNTSEIEEISPDTHLPTFDVQPAMLAVDLVLGPGESRSYTYTLPLPTNLPPTFRGRVMKFSYNLIVGACRSTTSSTSSPNPQGHNPHTSSTSQVMRVPIRIYNHVDVSGLPRPYDLLWPIHHPLGKEQPAKIVEIPSESPVLGGKPGTVARRVSSTPLIRLPINSPDMEPDPKGALRDYALRLMAAFPDPGHGTVSAHGTSLHDVIHSPNAAANLDDEREMQGGGELTGCREVVEVLTRNMRKVSYDVNKDGVKVAVLTFTKSAYRLGETVVGVVEMNERSSCARVLKLSAMLEAHETLPSTVTPFHSSQSKKLRKLHASHHSSLTTSALRTSFALDIPSDAAPAFQCTCGNTGPLPPSRIHGSNKERPGGLEWKVRLCLLVSVASEHSRQGFDGIRLKHLVRDGQRGEWGSAWRATKGIAPLQNIDIKKQGLAQAKAASERGGNAQEANSRGWASYLLSGFLSSGEREYHDGDEDEDEEDYDAQSHPYGEGLVIDEDGEVDIGGGDQGWSELRVETVECEVPIAVWPGNTAFRPLEVVFDV